MKKLFALFALCFAVLFALCGCSDDTGKFGKNGKMKIGVSVPAPTHGWAAGVVWNAEQMKKELEEKYPGCEVIVVTAKDSAEQVKGLENLLMQDVDALVIMAQDPVPLTRVCKNAKKQGKFVAIVSNPLTERVEDVFVNGDNRSFGVEAARALGNELKGQGKIVYLRGNLSPIDKDRTNGFLETLKAEYPGITVLDSAVSHWNRETGMKEMELLLQKHGQIDGVWAGDDDVLHGALQAYQKTGRSDVQVFVGGGGAQSVVKMVASGDPIVKATVTYPPEMISAGIQAAVDFLKDGKKPEKEIIIRSKIITKDNAKDFFHEGSPY